MQVAEGWLKEARLYLETKQNVDALCAIAHGIVVGAQLELWCIYYYKLLSFKKVLSSWKIKFIVTEERMMKKKDLIIYGDVNVVKFNRANFAE